MKELLFSRGFYEKFNDLINADVVYDINEFINTPADKKLAIVVFDSAYQWDANKEVLEILEKHADHVVISMKEVTPILIPLVKLFDKPKFTFSIGWIPNFKFKHAKWIFNSFWLWKQHYHYYLNNEFVSDNRLNTTTKQFKFECLYGVKKPHREYIRRLVSQRGDFLHSEFSDVKSPQCVDNSIFWEDDIVKFNNPRFIKFMDREMLPMQVMPFKVYNASHYSLVCETCADNDFSFYTEKIAKPILAKRLFIPVTGQYYLRNLRTVGFKTFDGIIDESFDNVADDDQRFDMVMEEVDALSKLDTVAVLEQCEEIFKHNREVLITMSNSFKNTVKYVNSL